MLKRQSEESQATGEPGTIDTAASAFTPPLSRHEWKAILAAFLDTSVHSCSSPSASRSPGFLGLVNRTLESLMRRHTEPTDPKMEKLRDFVCFARQHGRPSQHLSSELVELGYTDAQVRALTRLAVQESRSIGQ